MAQKERELGESDTVSALQRQAAGRQGDTASVVTGEPIYKQHRRELARIQKATAKSANPTKERQVWEALASLEEDSKYCAWRQMVDVLLLVGLSPISVSLTLNPAQ